MAAPAGQSCAPPLRLAVSNVRVGQAISRSLSEHGIVTVHDHDEVTANENGLIVGVFDVNERAAQLRWQQRLRSAGRPFLRVECEPDSICVGPFVVSSGRGCIECLLHWSRTEWSELNRVSGPRPGVVLVEFERRADIIALLLLERQQVGLRPCEVVVHSLATHECSARRFIPHPFCRSCARAAEDNPEAARMDLTAVEKSDVRAFRAGAAPSEAMLVDRFKDRRIGMVRYLFDEPTSAVMPMAVASFLQDGSLSVYENGYGRATTRGSSRVIAMLEALERYAGYMPRGKRSSVRGCFSSLGDEAVDPRSFILHAACQVAEPGFQLVPYSEELEFNWVWGYSLRRRAAVLVPEQLVYYRLPNAATWPTNRFVYEVSNGCAIGSSVVEAALNGLFETIERDAFLNTWYLRCSPVPLDVSDSDDVNITALLARAEAAGYEVHLFDVSSRFGVVVVWAMIVNPSPDAPVKSYSAAGASIDPERAVFSALVEVCTSIPVYEQRLPQQRAAAEAMLLDPAKVQTMEDHVVLYSHPASFDRFAFLFAHHEKRKLKNRFASWYATRPHADLSVNFLDVTRRVLGEASDVIVVDQGFQALADANLHCVKVLAPGLTPVTFGHQYRRVSPARLRQYAGLSPGVDLPAVNPFPHNFP